MYEHKLGFRLLAFIIDSMCIGLVVSILTGIGIGEEVEFFGYTTIQLTYFQNLMLLIVYYVGFAVFNDGITIGKMALGLKIKDTTFVSLSKNKIIAREFLKVMFMPISFISFLFVALREDHKSIHDMLMNSIVLKEIAQVPGFYQETDNETRGYQEPRDDFPKKDDYYDDPAEKNEENEIENKENDDDFYY